jgi:hypothetical protein
MQRKTFNRIIVVLMLIAVVIPGIVAIVDFLSPAAPFVGHIVGYFALMEISTFWVIGYLFTLIFYLAVSSLAKRIFWFQCSFGAAFLVMILIFAFSFLSEHH